MERDRRELSEDLRARYAVRGDEAWGEVLCRFLGELPGSPLRHRFVREQFRSMMNTRYPVAGGTSIGGRVRTDRQNHKAQDLPPCVIHLDHFAVACSDRSGHFVARGIPTMDDAVNVPLRIANHAVLSTSPVAVHLPQLAAVRIDVDLPVVLRASGRHPGKRLPDLEESPVLDVGLDALRDMVDQL